MEELTKKKLLEHCQLNEVRVIITFPKGLNYVGEILEHNGDIGLVLCEDESDDTLLIYFGYQDVWWIYKGDVE